MYRLLSCTAVVFGMALTPALAADIEQPAHPINQRVPKSRALRRQRREQQATRNLWER